MSARWYGVLSEAGMTLLEEAPRGSLQTSEKEFQQHQQQDDQDGTAISPRVEGLDGDLLTNILVTCTGPR